jgi:hypothetical protein
MTSPTETYALRDTNEISKTEHRFNAVGVIIFYWWVSIIFTWMGAPVVPEDPKLPVPKSWDERHPTGWSEWHLEKPEPIPVIKWVEELDNGSINN